MLKLANEGSKGGNETMLFNDCANTYANEEIAAVCITVKSDQPNKKAKKRL
jgi:hypothetical protein